MTTTGPLPTKRPAYRRSPATVAERPVAIPPFMSYIHLVSIGPTRNRRRFWRLQWHPTLWEGQALLCIWGRIGTLGRVRVLGQADSPQGGARVDQLLRRRLRHGYELADWQ